MYSDVESYVELPINGKKTNKPLMEKKRRARINRCLAELKDILIKDNHASAGHAKWEKADILEMTVDYVKKLREQKGLPELTRTTASVPNSVTDEAEDTTVASKSPVSVSSPPSTSSTEFTSIDGPPDAKRRRRSDQLMMPCPVPPSVPHAPTAVHGFNFLAQQYFAMQQFQHNLKLASTAPAIIPGATIPSLPSPVALHIPWRM